MELPLLLALMAIGYILAHDLAGETLLAHNPYDNYTRQALAWLNGRMDIQGGGELTWLELAIYGGKYYVSFPPAPALVMLPLASLFGLETPNNLVVAVYAMLAVAGAYCACRNAGLSPRCACFWGFFAVMASNMLEISTSGGVWLQAQTLNMALLAWAICCLLKKHRILAMTLLALAVGCRPFSALYILSAAILLLWEERGSVWKVRLVQLGKSLVPVLCIAAAYMWYNAARFGNPLEFGHNYLPEFLEAEKGQFHISYLLPNLGNLLFRPVTLNDAGGVEFPQFDGFLFYVANPFFLVWFVRIFRDIRARRMDGPGIVICLCALAGLLCICLHKTLGGWQFGARYTLDLLPCALLYLLRSGLDAPKRWEAFLCAFGILFNAYGMVYMRLLA